MISLDFGDVVATDLAAYLRSSIEDSSKSIGSYGCRIFSMTADQIEAQTKPARIPEPGWDGKVLAHTLNDDTRREFVRHGKSPSDARFNWSDGSGYGSNHWPDLINPTLIREGLS